MPNWAGGNGGRRGAKQAAAIMVNLFGHLDRVHWRISLVDRLWRGKEAARVMRAPLFFLRSLAQ
jgi:hypothetical protein